MKMNYFVLLVSSFVPLIIGFIWYGSLFNNTWVKEAGFTKDSLPKQNIYKLVLFSYIFSLLISFFLTFIVIHQMGVLQVLQGEVGFNAQTGAAFTFFEDFLTLYGDRFRTFGHGALHGVMSGFIFVLPILAITAMFNRKSAKYVAINAGYWIVTLGIMGGIICRWI